MGEIQRPRSMKVSCMPDLRLFLWFLQKVGEGKNFIAPFYGWGSTAPRLQPFRGGSLLFTTKFPEISGTHFIDLGRMKG